MKTLPLRPVAARLMPLLVIVLALTGISHARAQSGASTDASNFYEQGDEMSRRVGGFLRHMFYGEDRTSMYPPPSTPPPSTRAAPPPGVNYQYAPPPVPTGRPVPRPSSPAPVNEQERPLPVHRKPAHVNEPEQIPHRETTAVPDRPKKHAVTQDTPPKHVEESPPKVAIKPKNYLPPTLSHEEVVAVKAKQKNRTATSTSHDTEASAKPKQKSSSSPSGHADLAANKPKQKSSSSPTPRHDDVAEARPKHTSSPPISTSGNDTLDPVPSEPSQKETVVIAPGPEEQSKLLSTKKVEPTRSASAKNDTEKLSPYTESFGHNSFASSLNQPPSGGTKVDEPRTKEKDKETDSAVSSPAGSPGEPKFPAGTRGSHAGRVISPYPPHNELDVSGLPSGSLAVDPTTSKVFRVP